MAYRIIVKTLDGTELANTPYHTKEEYEGALMFWTSEDNSPLDALPNTPAIIITSLKEESKLVPFDTKTVFKS